MTLTHLPTRFSDFVNSPFGFVSSAEGLRVRFRVARGPALHSRVRVRTGHARSKLWKRSFKVYGYHLLMLAFAFTVAAAFAVHTHKAAHEQPARFLFAHP